MEKDEWGDGAFTVTEAEQFSGVKKSTLYTLIASGQLTASKIGGRRVISRSSLRALLAHGSTATKAAA